MKFFLDNEAYCLGTERFPINQTLISLSYISDSQIHGGWLNAQSMSDNSFEFEYFGHHHTKLKYFSYIELFVSSLSELTQIQNMMSSAFLPWQNVFIKDFSFKLNLLRFWEHLAGDYSLVVMVLKNSLSLNDISNFNQYLIVLLGLEIFEGDLIDFVNQCSTSQLSCLKPLLIHSGIELFEKLSFLQSHFQSEQDPKAPLLESILLEIQPKIFLDDNHHLLL